MDRNNTSTSICIDREGNQDITRYPCSEDGNPAQCCGDGEVCASNGLCGYIEPRGGLSYWQNTCTVPGWINGTVETCPIQCAHIANSGNGVKVCGSELYCCIGFEGCDCNNSTQVFSLPAVRIVTTITSPIASRSSATTSASTSTSLPNSSAESTTSSPTPITGGSDTHNTPTSSDNKMGLGLGVGIAAGICITIAALAVAWFVLRRRQRAESSSNNSEKGYAYKRKSSLQEALGSLRLPHELPAGSDMSLERNK